MLTESSSSTIFCECEQLMFGQNWAYAQAHVSLSYSLNGPDMKVWMGGGSGIHYSFKI